MVAPLLKWPGGKTRELPAILGAMPAHVDRLVDPFVGGGALLFAVPPSVPAVVNDASADLVDLYRRVQVGDEAFLARADALATWWDDLAEVVARHGRPLVEGFHDRPRDDPGTIEDRAGDGVQRLRRPLRDSVPPGWAALAPALDDALCGLVPAKLGRMRGMERRRGRSLPLADVWRNVEGAVRAALYTTVRGAYNADRRHGADSAGRAARFLFVREFAYAAMFRFNRRGEFNVPYGGITYNRKSLADRVAHLRSDAVVDRLVTTTLSSRDFEVFLEAVQPGPDDLVFLDPPYDSDFSSYDQHRFDDRDHARLAATIRDLPCRFQLVIKDTPLVRRLYLDPRWHVRAFDLTYGWTIKDRNDRATTHLLVTDVDPGLVAAS